MNPLSFLSSMTPGTKKTLIICAAVAFISVCAVVSIAMYTGNMDALIEFRRAAK